MFRRPRTSILVLILLSLLCVATGCGSVNPPQPVVQATMAPTATSAPTATAPASTPAPTAPVSTPTSTVPSKCTAPATSTFPAGTYSAIDASGTFLAPGDWVTLILNADGSSNRGPRGCYVLAGDQFTITEFLSSPHLMNDCQSTALTGVYTRAYAGKILSFTLVNDRCQERINELTSYRWEINPAGS